MDRGIGNENCPPTDKRHCYADGAMPRAVVNGTAHVIEGHGEISGEAGHQPIGIIQRHHASGKHVAVLVHKTLAVTEQEAVALQAFIQEIGIIDVSVGYPRVENLDILMQLQAVGHQSLFDFRFAADENGGAQSCGCKTVGGADHAILLTFGKHHTLGLGLDLIEDGLQRSGNWIKPRRQLGGVFVHIGKMLARHPGFHRGFCNGDRNPGDQPGIKRHRNKILRPKGQARAVIGCGHFVGHIFTRQARQRLGCGDLHLFIDGAGPDIKCSPEYIREPQDIVYLVGIIRAARCHDGVRADLGHVLGKDFRIGICHSEDDRIFGHALDHLRGEGTGNREAKEYIRTFHGIGQAAGLRGCGVGRLPLVHAFGAPLVNHAL